MNVSVRLISAIVILAAVSVVWADDEPSIRHHETGDDASKSAGLQGRDCRSPPVRLVPLRASNSKRPTLGFTNNSLNPSCRLPSLNGSIIRASTVSAGIVTEVC